MDQMSSCDSSSDSKSSSSSSSEDSSSDSDEECRSSSSDTGNCTTGYPTLSTVPHFRTPDIDASHNKYESSDLLMNTLSKSTQILIIKKEIIHSETIVIII